MDNLSPAIIGFIGVLMGGLLSFVANYLLKRKETQLRIVEKVFERRIKAHEDILKISQRLRTTISINTVDEGGNALTYPSIIHSLEFFENFKGFFYEMYNPNLIWLDLEIQKELNYIQDYLESLTNHLIAIPEERYPEVGLRIKKDIIDLAADLEKKVRKFFRKDIYSVKLALKEGHHKYPKEETFRRYRESLLGKNYDWLNILKS